MHRCIPFFCVTASLYGRTPCTSPQQPTDFCSALGLNRSFRANDFTFAGVIAKVSGSSEHSAFRRRASFNVLQTTAARHSVVGSGLWWCRFLGLISQSIVSNFVHFRTTYMSRINAARRALISFYAYTNSQNMKLLTPATAVLGIASWTFAVDASTNCPWISP
jgi:hypothetical protein